MSELQDLAALIRADTPLIVIETPDETRVLEMFRQSLLQVWRALYRWSITEARNTRPLSVLMAEQVAMLRAWARERTVPAD